MRWLRKLLEAEWPVLLASFVVWLCCIVAWWCFYYVVR